VDEGSPQLREHVANLMASRLLGSAAIETAILDGKSRVDRLSLSRRRRADDHQSVRPGATGATVGQYSLAPAASDAN
jgi:hypothetical protein